MNISTVVKTARTVITANSPVLLVGTAIAGVVATGVLAAKGGYKARGIIDAARAENGQEPSTQEKVQLTWLCYAVPALTGASAIASVAGVHTIHTKRHTALAGLYAITSTKLDDYTEKAEELLGPKKTQLLNNEIAQQAMDEHPFVESEVIITGNGTELCFDQWSGRYFMGSMATLQAAINEINRRLIAHGDAALNDWYDQIGLPDIPMGETFGWTGAKIDGKYGATTTSDGRPAISVWFHQEPKESLGRR